MENEPNIYPSKTMTETIEELEKLPSEEITAEFLEALDKSVIRYCD